MTPADIFDAASQSEMARYRQHGSRVTYAITDYRGRKYDDAIFDHFDDAVASRFIRDRGFEAGMRALAKSMSPEPPAVPASVVKRIRLEGLDDEAKWAFSAALLALIGGE